ncbi:MAG: UDP-N-acetylmuramoyl-L-alanine--D-glutamate ligase [Firmicutes bacterium]|nr:UDP-N-acetylmuramoyl-L-alanine--D-glutamate ligase [Bacillota bacterium]
MEKILIMGLGRSGLAAAGLLKGKAQLYAWDAKPEENFDEKTIAGLKEDGVVLCLGPDAQDELIRQYSNEENKFDRVVISPGISASHPVAKLGKELIGELELAYENCAGTFVAITGTNGKTTTTTLVGEILKEDEIPSMVVGNIGLPVSAQVQGADENTIMVTEVSSFQLETIKSFKAHVAAILNITPDHLDRHGTVEEYARIKGRVYENQDYVDFLIFNADDPGASELAAKAEKPALVPFSILGEGMQFAMQPNAAFVREGYIYVKKNGKEKKLCKASDLNIPGRHNLENALAAAAIAYFSGARAQAISRTLKTFKGVEHRIEYVRTLKGVRYVNDSKGTNPDSTIKAIEATDTPIILIAGGYEKHSDFTEMLNIGKDKIKYLVLLGVTAPRIRDTALACGYKDDQIVRCDSLEACVAASAQLADKGDTVLLSPACASWGMFANYEQRGEEFKRIVKTL